MKYKLKEYSISQTGDVTDSAGRPLQEDSMFPPCGSEDDAARIFVLCDGMGGSGAGDVASHTVCDAVSRYVVRRCTAEGAFTQDEMHAAISAAYDALDVLKVADGKKMGTTLAALKFYDNGYMTAHIGDTRIYHIRPGEDAETTRIVYATEDHSLVNYLMRKGEMTPEEALTSPKRHVITRALQPNMARRCKADYHTGTDVRTGDYFLLCTAGMLDCFGDDYLCSVFSKDGGNDRNKLGLLKKATASCKDNHSAIIIHITDVVGDTQLNFSVEKKPQPKKKKTTEKMDKTAIMPKAAEAAATKARDFVKMHQEKGDTSTLLLKFLFSIIGILVAIMLVYYIFIYHDETLQTAGTAVDGPLVTPDGQTIEEEKYGYEITEQDIKNTAQQIAPEYEPAAEEEIVPETPQPSETKPQEQAPAVKESQNKPAQKSEPVTTTDEPILQE